MPATIRGTAGEGAPRRACREPSGCSGPMAGRAGRTDLFAERVLPGRYGEVRLRRTESRRSRTTRQDEPLRSLTLPRVRRSGAPLVGLRDLEPMGVPSQMADGYRNTPKDPWGHRLLCVLSGRPEPALPDLDRLRVERFRTGECLAGSCTQASNLENFACLENCGSSWSYSRPHQGGVSPFPPLNMIFITVRCPGRRRFSLCSLGSTQ